MSIGRAFADFRFEIAIRLFRIISIILLIGAAPRHRVGSLVILP